MKKTLLFLFVVFFCLAESFPQASFNTGTLEVSINEYGRIRLFTADETRQLQRCSILVGSNSTSVFDYANDAEAYAPTELVASPTSSDYEITGAYDNAYSGDPPDVIVELNAYGWTDENYTLVKYRVINNEVAQINATIGLDIIPELNQEYGFDSVTYDNGNQVIRFHRGDQVNMGVKLLSAPLSSLYSFEWYDGYSVDSDYWTWMNNGSLQPQYASNTADGPVTITAQEAIAIEPSMYVNVFYALALGNNEDEMLANITMAEEKYDSFVVGIAENELSAKMDLANNQPNPFSHSTRIDYQITEGGQVSLIVYDAHGREVTTLVNDQLSSGSYHCDFNASGFAEGIYYYTLRSNHQMITRKMVITR